MYLHMVLVILALYPLFTGRLRLTARSEVGVKLDFHAELPPASTLTTWHVANHWLITHTRAVGTPELLGFSMKI